MHRLVADAKRMSTGRVNKKAASGISTKATLEKQRQRGGVGGLGRGANPLKSFFPFDPLLLRRSHAYIESFYNHWGGPVEEEDMLILDEGREQEDGIFEMDYDGRPQEDDASEAEDGAAVMVSDAEKECNLSPIKELLKTPDSIPNPDGVRKAWTENMKRPRSQSMENGSW